MLLHMWIKTGVYLIENLTITFWTGRRGWPFQILFWKLASHLNYPINIEASSQLTSLSSQGVLCHLHRMELIPQTKQKSQWFLFCHQVLDYGAFNPSVLKPNTFMCKSLLLLKQVLDKTDWKIIIFQWASKFSKKKKIRLKRKPK